MRILVVDDNQDGAETMARGLELLGHDIRIAFNGGSAVKLAHLFKPHLILLDIAMSGIDGYETGRAIRNLMADTVRIVAVTGLSSLEDRQRSIEAGFDDHFGKPVDWTVLRRLLVALGPPANPPDGQVP